MAASNPTRAFKRATPDGHLTNSSIVEGRGRRNTKPIGRRSVDTITNKCCQCCSLLLTKLQLCASIAAQTLLYGTNGTGSRVGGYRKAKTLKSSHTGIRGESPFQRGSYKANIYCRFSLMKQTGEMLKTKVIRTYHGLARLRYVPRTDMLI